MLKMLIKVGDKLPSVKLFANTPANVVNLSEYATGKNLVLFGVPGAFTPGCSKTHLPGYVTDYDKYKQKGVDEIVCLSVNDPFVMEAWGKAHNVESKVTMLADTHGELARELGLVLDCEAALGNKRMQRFSMYCVNGEVKVLNLEPNGSGLTCSLSNNLLNQI